MIDCPICHVKNNDDARFCAECGQRLSAPTQPLSQSKPDNAIQKNDPGNTDAGAGRGRPQPKLHSPLLSGENAESSAAPALREAVGADEVNRLRQMAARAKEELPTTMPDTPYKNPFDPRAKAPTDQAAQGQSGSPDRDRPKLRSPLLSGDQLDDAGEQAEPQSGRQLRSPLLGGNSDGKALRSPLLGNATNSAAQEDDDRAFSGGGLRSPLLGGSSYGGPERRQPLENQSFKGPERRHSGLRSPMLGGNEYYDDEQTDSGEDADAIDEDDPNVLRSPLLAAKRPLVDRQADKTPSNSNTKVPARPTQSPQSMQLGNRPSPSNSYTSLRSLSSAAGATNREPAPPAPQSFLQSAADRQQPTTVPPAFQSVQASGTVPTSAPQSMPSPDLMPAADATNILPGSGYGIARDIKVQPPANRASRPDEPAHPMSTPSASLTQAGGARRGPTVSRLVADQDQRGADPTTSDRFLPPRQQSSALPALVGCIAVLLLIAKAAVFVMLPNEWKAAPYVLADQGIMAVMIVCLILLCFSQKSN